MLYKILRMTAQVALRRYYSELIVQGRENIPLNGPLLVVANHSNALVDAMLVVTTIHRRVLVTARASLFEGRILASVLRRIGVVPLLRVQDVSAGGDAPSRLVRNDTSLERVTDALLRGEVVLIFPEGISHDQPSMAQLKSGAARIALQAFSMGAKTLRILPVGLVYEAKERPGSHVLVKLGRPVEVGGWIANNSDRGTAALTREISLELSRVTLECVTGELVLRAIRLARALAMLLGEDVAVVRAEALENEPHAARQIEDATEAYQRAPTELRQRANALVDSLQSLEMRLTQCGMALEDALVPDRNDVQEHRSRPRDVGLACTVLALATIGRVCQWIPLRAARWVALYSLRSDPSRDQPAMRTILIALAMVPTWYALQAATITMLAGGRYAAGWLFVCMVGAYVDTRFRRLDVLLHTVRVYQSDRRVRESVVAEARELVEQARELTVALVGHRPGTP